MAEISVPRVSDKSLLKIFLDNTLKNREELGLTDQAFVSFNVGANTFRVNVNDEEVDTFVDSIRNEAGFGAKIHAISFNDASLHPQCAYRYSRSSTSFIDTFHTPAKQVNLEALHLGVHINNLLMENAEAVLTPNAGNDFEIASAHHEVLTRLEGMSAELIEKQVIQVQKLEDDKQAFLDERGAEFAEKVNAQDEAHTKKLEELQAKYQKRSDELDERQKQIEDADNTTARRKTTTRTLEEAQEKARKFNFSSSVGVRTISALILGLILVFVGAYNTYMASSQLDSKQSTYSSYLNSVTNKEDNIIAKPVADEMTKQYIYFLYLRIFLGSALMISSIIYLIRWFNSWADRIAQQELDNQMFIRDLNRAQLAVEMSLEWNDKKDGDIPPRLLDSLTEGLFKPQNAPQQELLHPAEQIAAALVRTSDKVTLPFVGGTIETNGKNMGKAKPVSVVPDNKAG